MQTEIKSTQKTHQHRSHT